MRRIPRFGVDGAAAILVESIEHDALEPGRSVDLLSEDRSKLAQRTRALHAQERGVERVMDRTLFWSLGVWLELEDRGALVMVNDPVESFPAGADAQRVRVVPALFAQHRTHLFSAGRIDNLGERPAKNFVDAH